MKYTAIFNREEEFLKKKKTISLIKKFFLRVLTALNVITSLFYQWYFIHNIFCMVFFFYRDALKSLCVRV